MYFISINCFRHFENVKIFFVSLKFVGGKWQIFWNFDIFKNSHRCALCVHIMHKIHAKTKFNIISLFGINIIYVSLKHKNIYYVEFGTYFLAILHHLRSKNHMHHKDTKSIQKCFLILLKKFSTDNCFKYIYA